MVKLKKRIVTSIAALLFTSIVISAEAKTTTFKDVAINDAYYEPIQKVVAFQIMNGYANGNFMPNQIMTRTEAASAIAKVLQLDLTAVKNPRFQDVSTTNSNYRAIAAVTNAGIFSTAKKFRPNDSLTRAEMAKITVKTFSLNAKSPRKYKDVNEKNSFYEYIGILGSLKIAENDPNYYPNKPINRAQFASFLEGGIDYKRSDKTEDLWDSWAGWDEIVLPPAEAAKKAKLLAESETAMQKNTTAIRQTQLTLEDKTKELQQAYANSDNTESKALLQTIEKQYTDAFKAFDKAIKDAQAAYLKSRKLKYEELKTTEASTEKIISDARKVLKNATNNTFNWDTKIDKTTSELKKLIKEGKNAESMNAFIKLYPLLEEGIAEAEKISKDYNASIVKTVTSKAKTLKDTISEANTVFKDFNKRFTDTLKARSDEGASYYLPLLNTVEDDLEEVIADYRTAKKNNNRSSIKESQEQMKDIVIEAEKILKRANVASLKDKKEDIQDRIDDIDKIFEDEQKYLKKQQDYLKLKIKSLQSIVKELKKAVKEGYRDDIEVSQNQLETDIEDSKEVLILSRKNQLKSLEKDEETLDKLIIEAEKALNESYNQMP